MMNDEQLALGEAMWQQASAVTVPQQQTVPWWQKVGDFISKATDVYNTAKPTIDQAKQAVNQFKSTSQASPALTYGQQVPGSSSGLTTAQKVAWGVGLAAAIGLTAWGVSVAMRKKKSLGEPETIDTEAEVVATNLAGVKNKKRKTRKRK